MGSSKSKSSIRIENNFPVINKSDINLLNKSVNTAIYNIVLNTNQKCSNQVRLKNVIDFSRANIKGDLNMGTDSNYKNWCKGNLEQEGAFTFKCINASAMQNAVGSKIIDTIMQKLRNSNSSDIIQKLNSQAKQAGLAFGSSRADSKVDVIHNYKQVNDTERDIQNVIKNVVTSNVTNNTISNCINQINQNQGFDASGALVKGDINFCNLQSNQVAINFVMCMNKNNITNKVTNQIAKSLGVYIKDDIKDDNKVKQKATSNNNKENFSTSYFTDPSECEKNTFKNIENILGLSEKTLYLLICCLFFITIISLSVYIYSHSKIFLHSNKK